MFNKSILGLLVLFLVAGLALGDSESYETLSKAPSDYRGSTASPLDGADSLDWSAPLSTVGAKRSLIPTQGNPTVYVSVDLSGGSNTVSVYCGLYQKLGNTYSFLGVAGVSTATSCTGTRAGGRYLHDGLLVFDTASATHVELRKTDPTGNTTVTLRPWLGGSDPVGVQED